MVGKNRRVHHGNDLTLGKSETADFSRREKGRHLQIALREKYANRDIQRRIPEPQPRE